MVDRQDIDALLIGSLYGELSSADEARLQAHLESHPADRTALADLTHARRVVRESRILEVQLDPPQSVSALLIQEAARRAPKPDPERVGWFQRFMRGFMLHPAMAAAAMLVLVVGVAGTMYLRKGDQFAGQTKSSAPALEAAHDSRTLEPAGGAGGAEAASGAAPAADQAAAGSAAYQVRLDEQDAVASPDENRAEQRDAKLAEELGRAAPTEALGFEAEKRKGIAASTPSTSAPKPARKAPRLDVTTETASPKDFDDGYRAPAKKKASRTTTKGDFAADIGGGLAVGAGESNVDRAPAPPQAAPAQRAMEPTAPRAPAAATATPPPPPPPVAKEGKAAGDKAEAKPADPELTWAQQQHARVLASVRAGNCSAAANTALAILNRNAAYYAQHLENNRDLKKCNAYIVAQREKQQQEAERAERARATKRGNEPAKPAAEPTTK